MKALRVLVIEDDALIAMLLAELLAGMGHDVCATAATEAEAVIAAARSKPTGGPARRSSWSCVLGTLVRSILAPRGPVGRPFAAQAMTFFPVRSSP